MNISNFFEWFITQFVNIGSNLLGKIDEIIISGNISLLDFIVTIAIIGAFINIIITIPTLNVVERRVNLKDRQARREAQKQQRKRKG